ncbi:igE-binding protein-like [Microtus oregoni]|uniref:igE-binding protein-like n=1 Tax=Microtus oregoni TaxID=111838 RepID=UPI001BB1064C|nr:igE-binding protein-like [Microtus oregoni]
MAPFSRPIQRLLRDRDLKISEGTIRKFLEDVDRVAPWFGGSGDINLPCWNKLGRALETAKAEGKLRPGSHPLWKLVRACLRDGKCVEAVKEGRRALLDYQDSMSELDTKEEMTGEHKKHRPKEGDKSSRKRESDKSSRKREGDKSSRKREEKAPEKDRELEDTRYPLLEEFPQFCIDESSEDEDQLEVEEEGLEEDLEEAAVQYERGQCSPEHTKPPPYDSPRASGTRSGPSAPPATSASFIKPGTWSRLAAVFPVFQDPNTGQRFHEPVAYKQLKDLAEATQTYGVSASFTLGLVERLGQSAMTPADWMSTVKACVTLGQYLDFRSIYTDYAYAQARINADNGNAAWTADMLLGQGQWINNQTVFPIQVYQQINEIATRAWKALRNRGQVSGNLTKIIQGPAEPFSDFVARMMEAAGRVFSDMDQCMPLVEQLVYEQCTKECRRAITPWKGKGLQAWMKACREIGGPLTNSGLAAAVLAAARMSGNRPGVCFKCGQPGHIRKTCPNGEGRQGGGGRQPASVRDAKRGGTGEMNAGR